MDDNLLVAIPAAGASRRLGQPKQLVNIDGEPLLRRQCRAALAAQVGPVVVIIGCHAETCAATIADLPVSIRFNAYWQEGLASSIREAARAAIETAARGLLILHCDQYRVTSADLQRLHAAWGATNGSAAVRSQHEVYIGPPVIIPAACFDDALQLRGDEGARRVLSKLGAAHLVNVHMPSAIYDLDLPDQLSEIHSKPVDERNFGTSHDDLRAINASHSV